MYTFPASHGDSQKQPPRQFSKIVFFFSIPEQPFYNFPESRDMFFPCRRVYLFFKTETNFPGGFIEKHVFSRRFYPFVEQTLLSHRAEYSFSRKSYLVLEHILFSKSLYFLIEQIFIFQEVLSSPRTHIIF